MKCTARVTYGWYTFLSKQQETTPVVLGTNRSTTGIVYVADAYKRDLVSHTIEVCGGKIVPSILVIGGTPPHFEIRYKCDTCHRTEFDFEKSLPKTREDLELFLADVIANYM